jgi:hypothetical protein
MSYFADILLIRRWIFLNYLDILVSLLSKSFIMCLLSSFIEVML